MDQDDKKPLGCSVELTCTGGIFECQRDELIRKLKALEMYKAGGICDFAGINAELRREIDTRWAPSLAKERARNEKLVSALELISTGIVHADDEAKRALEEK